MLVRGSGSDKFRRFLDQNKDVLYYNKFTVLEVLTATIQKYHPRQSYDVC
jgi:hypothetical protein